jgi:hypothetical protein
VVTYLQAEQQDRQKAGSAPAAASTGLAVGRWLWEEMGCVEQTEELLCKGWLWSKAI